MMNKKKVTLRGSIRTSVAVGKRFSCLPLYMGCGGAHFTNLWTVCSPSISLEIPHSQLMLVPCDGSPGNSPPLVYHCLPPVGEDLSVFFGVPSSVPLIDPPCRMYVAMC